MSCGAMHNVHVKCVSIILHAFILWTENNESELVCQAVIENHPPYTIIMSWFFQYVKFAYTLY